MTFTIFSLVLIVLLSVLGYHRGAVVSCIAMVIMALGACIGVAVVTIVVGDEASAAGALVGAFVLGGLFAVRADAVSEMVTRRIGSDMRQFDRAGGLIISALAGCALVWLVSAVALLSPGTSPLLAGINASAAARLATGVVPPSGTIATAILRSGLAPSVDGPTILVGEPDDAILNVAAVQRTRLSVVRVEGRACQEIAAGTGWVVARGLVITNAHVVAGMRLPTVLIMGRGDPLPATVRSFDPVNDVAVLAVPGLPSPPLKFAADPPHGTRTAVVGFPKLEGLIITPARYDRTMTVPVTDIYDAGHTPVPVVLFRGDVQPGNSGSPMVNEAGDVVAMIAAHALNQAIDGGFAVPNSAVSAAISRATGVVSTGPCMVEHPKAAAGGSAAGSTAVVPAP